MLGLSQQRWQHNEAGGRRDNVSLLLKALAKKAADYHVGMTILGQTRITPK